MNKLPFTWGLLLSGLLIVPASSLTAADSVEKTNPTAVVRTVLGDSSPNPDSGFRCTAPDGAETFHGVRRHHVGAVNLAYVEGPDNGTPLVILPGMAVPWQSYIGAAERLCHDFHLFIVTQRGHDITGWAKDRAYHVSDYGEDVTKLIREVIRQPVIISGHSLGGLVALWVASTQPDIVAGFNAEDGAFLVNEKARWEQSWIREMFVGLEQRLRAYHEQGASIEELTRMFGQSRLVLPSVYMSYDRRIVALGKLLTLNRNSGMPSLTEHDRPRVYRGYKKYLAGTAPTNAEFWPQAVLKAAASAPLKLDPEVVRASVTAELVAGFNNRTAFAKVRAPMLYWESDREMLGILTPAEHQDLVDLVRSKGNRARHVYAQGSGHRIHFDAPEKFADEIRQFFKQPE